MTFTLPKLIGHRGLRDLAPENTLCSIKRAVESNLNFVEVDVKITKDKIPFLLHDDLLDRTTNGIGLPYKYNYKEIKNLDAGSWVNAKYKNLYPPTLEEVLIYCNKKNIGLNIELKPNHNFEEDNAHAVANLIKKKNFSSNVFISSFDLLSIQIIRNLLPNFYLGYLADNLKNFYNNLKKIKESNCFSIGLNIDIINMDIITICKKNNLLINVYSEKNIELSDALKLWDMGISSIFIDNTESYLKKKKLF